jgi:hypothetical protein
MAITPSYGVARDGNLIYAKTLPASRRLSPAAEARTTTSSSSRLPGPRLDCLLLCTPSVPPDISLHLFCFAARISSSLCYLVEHRMRGELPSPHPNENKWMGFIVILRNRRSLHHVPNLQSTPARHLAGHLTLTCSLGSYRSARLSRDSFPSAIFSKPLHFPRRNYTLVRASPICHHFTLYHRQTVFPTPPPSHRLIRRELQTATSEWSV